MLVSTTEINSVYCILWPQYMLADIFHTGVDRSLKHRFLSTFRLQFPFTAIFRKSKNTDVCVILKSKWRQPEMLVLLPWKYTQCSSSCGLSICWVTFSTQELIVHKTLSSVYLFKFQFPPETFLKKFKNTDVCVILSSNWQQRGICWF